MKRNIAITIALCLCVAFLACACSTQSDSEASASASASAASLEEELPGKWSVTYVDTGDGQEVAYAEYIESNNMDPGTFDISLDFDGNGKCSATLGGADIGTMDYTVSGDNVTLKGADSELTLTFDKVANSLTLTESGMKLVLTKSN